MLELKGQWNYYFLTINAVTTDPKVNSFGSKLSLSPVAWFALYTFYFDTGGGLLWKILDKEKKEDTLSFGNNLEGSSDFT